MGKIKTEKGKDVVPPATVPHGCARRSTSVVVLRAPPLSLEPSPEQRRPRTRHAAAVTMAYPFLFTFF
ncbi:host specificity protein [Sesbania bispinosa]|nr:host specificity protein [Sesbania bispinosa]